jgi:hypothetical protein
MNPAVEISYERDDRYSYMSREALRYDNEDCNFWGHRELDMKISIENNIDTLL